MREGLLKGKKGIIFGALNEKSIAWQVAIKAWEQGAELVLTNAPVAMRLGNIRDLAKMTDSEVIAADATKMEDIENLITESLRIFGGKFDFILHSIGMSPNVRKDIPYEQTSYENMLKTFYIYGRDRKVRVNTVSQSPTATTAGSGIHGFESLIDFSERMSPLGNASAEECADYCVVLFSDLTRKVTMQNLFHDGGFSSMGMSLKAIEQYQKSFEDCN